MILLEFQSEAALTYLANIKSAALDLSAPIRAVLESALADAVTDITAAKGSLYGGAWRPMTYFTQWFHKRDPSTLMESTGALAQSFVPGGANNVLEVTIDAGSAGSRDPKAGWQHFGTQRTFLVLQYIRSHGRLHDFIYPGITARPLLEWHPENFERYSEMFAGHLERANG